MTDMFAPGSRASAARAATNADQLEKDAVFKGTVSLSSCLTDDTIAFDEWSEEYDAAMNQRGNAEWAKDDSARETAVGDTIIEIERRRVLLAEHYPFHVSEDETSLSYAPERSLSGVYEFCLGLTVTRLQLRANPACRAVREFERMVGWLLKAYLHEDSAESYRSGSPPDGDRPTTIPEMLTDLHGKTHGEWEFSPRGGHAAQALTGDDGIDVIAWKPFGKADCRIGKPFLLVQCACGDDWFDKRSELNPEGFEIKWGGKISLARSVLRCLATPRHVPHEARWLEGTADGGILLDRVRLTWLGETCLAEVERVDCKTKLGPYAATLNHRT